jgi:DNA polymerase-4
MSNPDLNFWPRAILHVDMDAFYASVEQLDCPELRGKPVIVGGPKERGVVSAASYEARAFGVHSAMPIGKARRLCPNGIFLPVRMKRYMEISSVIHELFYSFTPVVQPISCDEAFLDVTGSQRLFGSPPGIAAKIKTSIREQTGLTASVGVAASRFVAKIASELEKPDGLTVIAAEDTLERLAPLAVGRIWGVGAVLEKNLHKLGIETIGQLRGWPRETLLAKFGSAGESLYDLSRGIDLSEVHDRDPEKSVSNETTFAVDVMSLGELENTLLALSDKVAARLRKNDLRGKTVQMKLRYSDFSTVTRRLTLPHATCTGTEIFTSARELLRTRTEAGVRPVRLIGVGVSGFCEEAERQSSLFGSLETGDSEKAETFERAVDQIRKKLGSDAIGRASQME